MEDYTAALQLHPQDADLYARRATANIKLGNRGASKRDAERADELQPGLMTQFLSDLETARQQEENRGGSTILVRGGDIPETSDPGGVRKPEELAREVLELVNKERAKRGVAPLRLSQALMDGAAIRAKELTQSFSHTRPDGRDCLTIIPSYTAAGENIAAGQRTPEDVVASWMQSPGHRENILDADFTEIGIGHAFQSGSMFGHYWVQLFRHP